MRNQPISAPSCLTIDDLSATNANLRAPESDVTNASKARPTTVRPAHQACAIDFAAEQDNDLKDYIHGGCVGEGFTWMILERRGC
jgi:hypothetical protein